MANHDTITVKDIAPIADRLAGRALSKFECDSPQHQCDMLTAARAMRAMARHLNGADILTINGD